MRRLLARLPQRPLAFAALVLTSALWASNSVLARGMLDTIPPVWLAGLRWVVVLLLLLPLVWKDRVAIRAAFRTHAGALAVFALLGFAPQSLLVYGGLSGTTAINVGLLNSSIPVMIFAIVATRLRRVPSVMEGLGLALSVTGVLLIIAHGDFRALARLEFNGYDLVILGAMLVWAFYTVKLGTRTVPLAFPSFCFAAAVMGLAMLLPAVAWELAMRGLPHITWASAAGIVYIGALPTLAGLLLFGYGIAHVGSVQAGIFTHLVPVFTALFALALLGERLHAFHAAGFALVAGGAILCCITPSPMLSQPPRQEPPCPPTAAPS